MCTRRKALLKQRHHQMCLKFTIDHLDNSLNSWEKVLWMDEQKLNFLDTTRDAMFGNTAFDKNHVVPTVKHGGGSIMI